jgi:serine/threonine-protein kinase
MRFGRYELLDRLGAGGMGEVWRARDHDLHREVAVKFLPERFASDPMRLGRFAQEARAASSLNHPHIVTIHEVGETSGLPYIVMELVEGQTLRALLHDGPLSAERLLEIGAQLASGLAKAHAAGIVHRDLKPDNVMVTPDHLVKILDFGLAKLRASDGGDALGVDSGEATWPKRSPSPQTAAGALLGTVGYMSPEQAGGRPVDHRSDQFVVGSILYEMATGRPAFRRETPAQTLAAIIERQPEPIASLSPTFPAPARWIVERCLAKDPAERYASTLDLAHELQDLREHLAEVGGSGSDAPTGPVAPAARTRPPRSLRIVGTALALFAVAAAVPALVPSVRERLAVALRLRAVPADKRIAVLPFRAAGGTEDDRALADGLVEFLAARLAQLERFQSALSVEPASNVRQAGVTSAATAGRTLGVTMVVAGSVQRVEGRLVLTAILEDTRRNRTLRADTADSPETLVAAVARLLELELGPDAEAALGASGTGVAEAATLSTQALGFTPYAEGRTALERYDQSRSIERAIELFTRALERDPRYALAHAGLGEAYWRLYLNTKRPELVRLAESHCERALALDDLLAPAWTTLGIVHAGTSRAEKALEDFRHALARDPRSPDAHRERGLALERLGRWDEAEATYRRAIELRPDLWSNYNYLGVFLQERGRYAEAEAAHRQAHDLAPDNARVLSNLAAALYYQDRVQEAEKTWTRSLELQPWPTAAANLAALQFSDRRYAEAAQTLEKAAATGTTDYRIWRNLGAALYWAPGERANAPDAYRRAASLGEQERRLDPKNARLLAQLADCYAMLGEGSRARPLAAEAGKLAPTDRRVGSTLAGVFEQLGDREAALHWLGAALQSGYPRADLDSDPTFEKLRTDPRWKKLALVQTIPP